MGSSCSPTSSTMPSAACDGARRAARAQPGERDDFHDRRHKPTHRGRVLPRFGRQDPQLLQSMYIFRQPHIGGEVPCHTDHTFLWTDRQNVVGFWFAIDDVTTVNGRLWVKPGGHRPPVGSRFGRT
ncbi:MAG: hypothetical protein F2812_02630, partial [Actinobacteria bacterium]|nr:hypothetical protein [Actinomycetota bacterium]MSY72703.1 hypothetical protein [Actinomycetota bacterium]